jgi:hypothetical protein
MRKLAAFIVCTVSCSAYASIPDLVCQEVKAVFVDPVSLPPHPYDSKTLYRLNGGNLFLASPD